MWYAENRQAWTHYYLIDFLIAIAGNQFLDVQEILSCVPYNNSGALLLARCLSEPYNAAEYKRIVKDCTYQKLTWKTDWTNKEKQGTFYAKILESEGIRDSF
jgi:hypothetical protein